jgi:hypothetical protein
VSAGLHHPCTGRPGRLHARRGGGR